MRGGRTMLVGIVAAAVLPAAAHGKLRPPSDSGPLRNELLSNERTVTRWAYARTRGKVRVAPRRSARSFTRLHKLTELGTDEVYLALRSRLDAQGRAWIQIRVPMRPNGRTGWVPRSYLHEFQVNRDHLRVNRRTLRATLYRRGRVIWTSRIGIGTAATPTPAGRFYIRQRLRNQGGSPAYGPWALGTSAYAPWLTEWPAGGVIGIHGTDQPQLIPGRPSHGCVRVPNRKISQLARLVRIGTPVTIL